MTWLNLNMPNQRIKNGLKAEKIKLSQRNFVLKKQLIKFSCTYWPLSFCKIWKKLLGLIQSYEDVPFSGPKWPICDDFSFVLTFDWAKFKGCVRYSFATLLSISKREHLRNKEKCFLFHFESSSRSWDNQTLTF